MTQLASATPLYSPLVGEDNLVHDPAWLEWFRRVDGIAQSASLNGALLKANNLSDVASASTSRSNLSLGASDSPTFTGLTLNGLTASEFVATDGSKSLVSVPAATLLGLIGLGPTSSPTFAGLTIDSLTGILRGSSGLVLTTTIGSSLSFVVGTLNAIQDIRTTASPTFAGLTLSVKTVTSNYPITFDDFHVKSNAAITITLPTAVGHNGRIFIITRVYGAGYTTIATTSSQTISGLSSPLLLTSQWDSITVQSDGANWIML